MNIFAAIALLACLVATICYYAAVVAFDRIHQLQDGLSDVQESKRKVQDAALDLLIECQLLRQRNESLEQRQRYCVEVIGTSMLYMPARVARLIKSEDKRMTVREGGMP